MMKKFIKTITYYGLYAIPMVIIAGGVVAQKVYPDLIWSGANIFKLVGISVFVSFVIFLNNNIKKSGGQKDFTVADSFRTGPTKYHKYEKYKAMYPTISDKYKSKDFKNGWILGKTENKYVLKRYKDLVHLLIIGTTGTGKSAACLIPNIFNIRKNYPESSMLVLDIKGELNQSTVDKKATNAVVFDPQNRNTYGYNPFSSLNESSSEQEIYEQAQLIAFSLIHKSEADSQPFWKEAARELLIGLIVHYYMDGNVSFIKCVDKILETPIKKQCAEAVEHSKSTVAKKKLIGFADMADETLQSVYQEVNNSISIFSTDQDIRYALGINNKVITPELLESQISIFISIKEEKLESYSNLLKLIINSFLGVLEKRPEGRFPIFFIIDELGRIVSSGKLTKLVSLLQVGRSKNIKLIAAGQSVSQLRSAYSEFEVADMLTNFPTKVILSAGEESTAKSVIGWVGKYTEINKSWNGKGSNNVSISYNEKDILNPSELVNLGDELIIVDNQMGYMRLQKCYWFRDKKLKPQIELIKERED